MFPISMAAQHRHLAGALAKIVSRLVPRCPCGTPCRVESGQAPSALSRSDGARRGLGSAPDADSRLRLCAVRP